MRNIFVLFALLFIVFPQHAEAHMGGLPTYFKINEKFAIPTSLQASAVLKPSFLIPQDIAADPYIFNEPISFTVDPTMLRQVLPPEILDNSKFYIDFGDKVTAEGAETTHTYSKIGSYIVTVHMELYDSKGTMLTKYMDPYLLHVIPEMPYKAFPQAVMTVNGKDIKDPVYGRADINSTEDVLFDASKSKASSTLEYRWDFGDGTNSSKSFEKHRFDDQFSQTVVLQIKDKNNFLSYAFVTLKNTQYNKEPQEKKFAPTSILNVGMIVLGLGLVILIIAMFRRKFV